MKVHVSIRQAFVGFLLLATLVTCRRKNMDVQPSGDALLLGVSIPGFPAENISIDHTKKQVILTVPSSLSKVDYEAVSFQTTPGSSVWRQSETRFWINLCRIQAEPVYVLSTTNTLNIYNFVIKPADALKVEFIDNQTTAIIGQPLYLQIENFLDGSNSGKVVLTRAGTSERDTLSVYCCQGSGPYPCLEGQKKQFSVGVPQRVRPGDYTVEVYKANGRRAIASQKLTFRKGTSLLNSPSYGKSATIKSRNVVFSSENLFADDSPELIFRLTTGASFRVKPTAVSPYGWNMTVDMPTSMPAGYYDVQLVLRGIPVDNHIRFPVLQQPDQPFVAGIYDTDSLLDPVSATLLPLQRKKMYRANIMPQISGFGGIPVNLQIKLVGLNESKQPFLFTFSTTYYNSDYPPGLVIPSSVSSGRYQFFVVATYPDGRVVESEPLERPVDIF